MYWYEEEVKHLENDGLKNGYAAETLFYGSSTFRLWENLIADLPALKPVNLGFGGSTLAACVWFFDRLMAPYQPKRLIVYAGDNDLGDGRHPEEVLLFFQQLVIRANKRFGNMPCYFVSLKPSINRFDIIGQFVYANQLIEKEIAYNANWRFINIFNNMVDAKGRPKKELYSADGLHLSPSGYQVWKQAIGSQVNV